MNKLRFSWVAVLCFLGAVFLMQCEDEMPRTERADQVEEEQIEEGEEFRRHEEGRGDEAAPGIAEGHEVNVVDDREELIENMRELLSDLIDELEERAEADEMEAYDQVQNDQLELNQLINEAERTADENWEEIKEDVQETYVRIAVDHNERVRPEGAHGGREFG